MTERLRGKVAVITGAGSGIGHEAARLFAVEGARLVVNDVSADGLDGVASSGLESHAVVGDAANEAVAAGLMAEAVERYGRIDVLYSNAGIGYSNPITHGSVLDIPPEHWDRVVQNNLRSVYLCCKFAIPHLIEAGGGSIINTSSIMGLGATPGADAYTASKGGIIALSRSLARQFGPQKIRVNVICPGSIATPMIEELLTEEGTQEREAEIPLRRIGRPEDVAYAALHFASDESSYTTGAVLVVDGGRTI